MKKFLMVFFIMIITLLIVNCDKIISENPDDSTMTELEKLEEEISNDLDRYNADTDFTLLIKAKNGHTFSHSTGNSSGSVLYRSASTSKLVTAVVILSLVKDGILSLEDSPQKYISAWPIIGNLSLIKLKHLLSFTSGMSNEPFCINLSNYDFEKCIENIISNNSNAKTPGEEFYYSSIHLQVAGLMAIKASGLSSWQELFEQFKSNTDLFSKAVFDLPSVQNPRLAGGMHWNGNEYLQFLEAIYKTEVLTSELIKQMTSDQLQNASIGNSPAINSINEDWYYGFGNWIECHSNPNNQTSVN